METIHSDKISPYHGVVDVQEVGTMAVKEVLPFPCFLFHTHLRIGSYISAVVNCPHFKIKAPTEGTLPILRSIRWWKVFIFLCGLPLFHLSEPLEITTLLHFMFIITLSLKNSSYHTCFFEQHTVKIVLFLSFMKMIWNDIILYVVFSDLVFWTWFFPWDSSMFHR